MNGICKLTRTSGKYVKSHLLPKALTRGSNPGSPFIQGEHSSQPIKRWDSWYDKKLVTRTGEDILSAIDNAGIAELRKHSLLWSGRKKILDDPKPDYADKASGVGTRVLSNVDVHAVRMFFLSLLWRCAASTLKEVESIVLPEDQLEQLRVMLVNRQHRPCELFPFTLTQLPEVGYVHNLAPLSMTMTSPVDEINSKPIKVFRFYIDGLIANIVHDDHHQYGELPFNEKEGKMIVLTVPTETSFETINLAKNVFETVTNYPNTISKIR